MEEPGKHFPSSAPQKYIDGSLDLGTMEASLLVLLNQSISHESCHQLNYEHDGYHVVVSCHAGTGPRVL
jgi:hypothetical protein